MSHFDELEPPSVATLRGWFPKVEFSYRRGVLTVVIPRGSMRFTKDFSIDAMPPEQVLPVVSRHVSVFSRDSIK